MIKAEVAALRQKLNREANRALVGGFRPPESPFASWFGKVLVGLPDEIWPVDGGSRLMMPLFQMNVAELPYCPPNLADVVLIAVFIAADELPASDAPNGEGWLLRSYSSLNSLVPLTKPAKDDRKWRIKPAAIRWEHLPKDYPCWDDVAELEMSPRIAENYSDRFENQVCTKVGGWPSLIQSEIFWAPYNNHPAEPEYVFQVNSEPKAQWEWGDGGVGHFGRGAGDNKDVWTLEWQCY